MRLVLDPAEDAAHERWLRETAGAYEWWYFDALADDGEWALTCIWFLGNPFSPYYRLVALGRPVDPFAHNALLFALYRHGKLHAYHFTRFDRSEVETADCLPATFQFGPNRLFLSAGGSSRLKIADENANCRRLDANLAFDAPPLRDETVTDAPADAHYWLPAAPVCRVSGQIVLRDAQSIGAQTIAFTGRGYHDHNWGRLPFDADIRDWYWARAALSAERAAVLYHVHYRAPRKPDSHLLLFDNGRLIPQEGEAQVRLTHRAINGFGTRYATQLRAECGPLRVQFKLGKRLDSAPFYVRAQCEASVTTGGRVERGQGLGEYFRPRILSWPLVASAMKARIVEA